MDIRNTTKRPLRVPLPHSKWLHLGPGATGQVAPKAADHPPFKKLVDEGELEILAGGRSHGAPGAGSPAEQGGAGSGPRTPRTGPSTGGVRHVGDR